MDRTPAHLADMLAFVREMQSLASGRTLEQCVQDRVLCLAVEKLFINLGEAARRVGPAGHAALPGVDWVRIIALRNILAHGYEQVEHEVLFKSIVVDLPPLAGTLEHLLDRWTKDAAP